MPITVPTRLTFPHRLAGGRHVHCRSSGGCLPVPQSLLLTSLLVVFATVSVPGTTVADEASARLVKWGETYERDVLPIIRAKCLSCHEGEEPEGEFDLAKFVDAESAIAGGDIWERVARRVRQNEMPPPGSPGLNDPQKAAFHRWVDSRPGEDLCRQIASDETQAWYRGHVMSRRLTAVEYTNAVLHLVGLPLLPSEVPPSDGAGGEGFDTVGDALFTSPIHLEAYLIAADRLIDEALAGDGAVSSDSPDSPRQRLLVSLPRSVDPDSSLDDDQAARKILSRFAKRAWRRPVADDEIDRLMMIFHDAQTRHDSFIRAIGQPLKAVLVSPHFLFVVESEPAEAGVQRITPHQLATRLALLIWSSIPDEELLAAADSGELYDDDVLRLQVRRMLADPKARGLGENFGLQWLNLRNFGETEPDAELFPEFTPELAADMREEAVSLVTDVFRNDRPLTDLIAADYSFMNGRLAAHYGLDLPTDAPWQRVPLSDLRRGGVATMASVLTSASYPRRTSPVLRGRWLLEELLGSRVPPPPPGVPALEEPDGSETTATSMRQRLEIHRQNPDCASCHDRMDPLGFGLENFDAIGRWRTLDHGVAIDATGTLPSGESFDGPAELKQTLLRRSDEFEKHFVRKLVGFAFGRSLNKFDQCVVDECLEALRDGDRGAGLLIEMVALSYPFQHRFFK